MIGPVLRFVKVWLRSVLCFGSCSAARVVTGFMFHIAKYGARRQAGRRAVCIPYIPYIPYPDFKTPANALFIRVCGVWGVTYHRRQRNISS